MRRWIVLAAVFVVAALVVWALAGDQDHPGHQPSAGSPGHHEPTFGGPLSRLPGASTLPRLGFNAAANNIINPSKKTGGTLRLLAGSDCDSWDPGRTDYGWCWNMQRLITRTLVGYSSVNGTDFKLGPDLATSLGRHNADYSQWTYTLRPGLKFSTGKPITPLDVKFGIERLFAVDVVNGGPSAYFINSIAHPNSYRGPYRSGDLRTITTTARSITFHLSAPNADFDYLMALPAAAPVPNRVEGGPKYTGATYAKHPVASGPFEIRSYQLRKSIVFERNPYWRQTTDDLRHPRVDHVRLDVDPDVGDIDRKLRAGRADARADAGVQTAFQPQILTDPRLKTNADDPVVAATRYLAVLPAVVPNVHCRRAIFYAIDKAAAVQVFGGPTAGVPANAMTPPGIDGYDPSLNPYPSGPEATGDIAAAKAELRACGKPGGFSVKLAYGIPSETGPNLFRSQQDALERVGIRLSFAQLNPPTYYCNELSNIHLLSRAGIGLVVASWSDAFPTGYGFYQDFPNRFGCASFDANLVRLHDPTINRVLAAAPLGRASDADWRALDRAVMSSATYLPLVWPRTLYYRNPRLTNVTCDNALASGIYDFVNVGVR